MRGLRDTKASTWRSPDMESPLPPHPLEASLGDLLADDARNWWRAALERITVDGAKAVPELFPALLRRLGSRTAAGGLLSVALDSDRAALIDRDVWRAADIAGFLLLRTCRADDELLVDLFRHGDLEERTIVLRAMALLPVTRATIDLLDEAQRSNVETHFQAAACDSNLPARAADNDSFGVDAFNRVILKAAFLGLSVSRLLEVETCANVELSRMLADLASEREAAGRAVWQGTNVLIAHAPTAGSLARLIGGLEHGDDLQRRAAAEGLLVLNRAEILPFIRERLPREPRETIRELLKQALPD